MKPTTLASPVLLLALWLALPLATAQAGSRGLILSDDSGQLFYLGRVDDTLLRNARPSISLTVAREQGRRNLLLQGDAELLDYQRSVLGTRTLAPKLGLLLGESHDNGYGAVLMGAILRQPADAQRRHDWLVELYVAPHLSDPRDADNDWRMDFEWNWGFRLQVNYPLPDQAELNLGFRRIMVDLAGRQPSSFDTGLFLGLSYRF